MGHSRLSIVRGASQQLPSILIFVTIQWVFLAASHISSRNRFSEGIKRMIESTLAFSNPFFTSLSQIKDEVRDLVAQKLVRRNQSLYCLCEFIPPREWESFIAKLEQCDYLLRDCIGDLLGAEKWDND